MKNSSDTIGNRTCDLPVSNAVFTLTDQYNFVMYHAWLVDRDSVVGITTRYGLEGPGIESRWGGEVFLTRSDRSWLPPRLLYKGYVVSFPGVKRPRRGVYHHPI